MLSRKSPILSFSLSLTLALSLAFAGQSRAHAEEAVLSDCNGESSYLGLGFQEVKPLSSDMPQTADSREPLSDVNVSTLLDSSDASRKLTLSVTGASAESAPANWSETDRYLPGGGTRAANMPASETSARVLSGANAPFVPSLDDSSDPRVAKFNADLKSYLDAETALESKKRAELAPQVRFAPLGDRVSPASAPVAAPLLAPISTNAVESRSPAELSP
jgi:hypothetical protein